MIAGAVIGGIVGGLILVTVTCLLRRKRRRNRIFNETVADARPFPLVLTSKTPLPPPMSKGTPITPDIQSSNLPLSTDSSAITSPSRSNSHTTRTGSSVEKRELQEELITPQSMPQAIVSSNSDRILRPSSRSNDSDPGASTWVSRSEYEAEMARLRAEMANMLTDENPPAYT
jgi:hypothetical protein